jgi:ribonuclease VapC
VIFIDTSVFIAILARESDRGDFELAVAAADRRLTSPIVRLEVSIVLAKRLSISPGLAERQFERFLEEADIVETPIDAAIGAIGVECFEKYGKGRHPARLNFADCLAYACARAHGAKLLFKGDDFDKTEVNG